MARSAASGPSQLPCNGADAHCTTSVVSGRVSSIAAPFSRSGIANSVIGKFSAASNVSSLTSSALMEQNSLFHYGGSTGSGSKSKKKRVGVVDSRILLPCKYHSVEVTHSLGKE